MTDRSTYFALNASTEDVLSHLQGHLREVVGPAQAGGGASEITLVKLIRRGYHGHGRVGVVIQECHPLSPELRRRLGLTSRQAEVASLLAARMTNPEIAQALDISVNTVRRHVEAVLLRLAVPNRNAVREAIEAACVLPAETLRSA